MKVNRRACKPRMANLRQIRQTAKINATTVNATAVTVTAVALAGGLEEEVAEGVEEEMVFGGFVLA